MRVRSETFGRSATRAVSGGQAAFDFPIVAHETQALSFWLFAAAMVVQMAGIWRSVPKPRRIAREALEDLFERRGKHMDASTGAAAGMGLA